MSPAGLNSAAPPQGGDKATSLLSADLTLPTPRQREREAQAGPQKYPVDRAPGTKFVQDTHGGQTADKPR
jgi:hypothetical protein